MLAGVRREYDEFPVLAEPRGLPVDGADETAGFAAAGATVYDGADPNSERPGRPCALWCRQFGKSSLGSLSVLHRGASAEVRSLGQAVSDGSDELAE